MRQFEKKNPPKFENDLKRPTLSAKFKKLKLFTEKGARSTLKPYLFRNIINTKFSTTRFAPNYVILQEY